MTKILYITPYLIVLRARTKRRTLGDHWANLCSSGQKFESEPRRPPRRWWEFAWLTNCNLCLHVRVNGTYQSSRAEWAPRNSRMLFHRTICVSIVWGFWSVAINNYVRPYLLSYFHEFVVTNVQYAVTYLAVYDWSFGSSFSHSSRNKIMLIDIVTINVV